MSKELRLGAFIVVTLSFLAVGVFLIGNRESLFRSTYRVKADFPNVAGLNVGADVRVGGIREGTVRSVNLPAHPGQAVTVVVDLERQTRGILKKDSVAAIRSEGLLGDKYVEITFGSEEAAPLKDGDAISSQPPFDISDLIDKTNQILDSATATAQKAESVATKIDEGQGTLGALVNDKTIYRKATAGVTSLQEDMEALKHNFLVRGFFRNRGYEDSADLTKYQLSKLPQGPYLRSFVYDSKQIFDKTDSAKLKNQKALKEVGDFLEAKRFGLAVVVASAGMKGDSEKERQLTEAQSMVVRNYLADNFRTDDTRIKTIGLGKTTEEGNKMEIIVYPETQKENQK
ncbi:MAG TPA: MlaD family protein [Bryobacteraceae bacterium]|jgi:phospholipid/cholesterol/gamma-HCH transport system substrate-binding protein